LSAAAPLSCRRLAGARAGTLILSGNNRRVLMAAPGRPMLMGSPSTIVPPPAVTSLSTIAGLADWWDAGVATGILSPGGTPQSAFGTLAWILADKSGVATPVTVWHAAASGTASPVATPRLLGGVGLNTGIPPNLPPSGQQLSLMDRDQGLKSAAMALGSTTAWTLFLVWSRPNWRQSSTAASTLLRIGGTQVLGADNNGGTRLMPFPGAQQTVLTRTLTRRHTHAVIFRNTPSTGVDV
jgi:hypothetical protein